MTYLIPAPPRVLAHRGFARDALENTAGAFAAALDLGVRHIETDAHASRDGVAVLWHDPSLGRFNGSSARIADLDWHELAALRAPRGERLLRLDEALDVFPAARLNIDVKTELAAAPVLGAVRAAATQERVLLTSFSDERRRRMAAELPGVATSVGSSAVLRMVASARMPGAERIWRQALAGAVAAQVPERMYGVRIVTPRFLRLARDFDVEVHVWTVNDPADMRRLLAMGVDGIVTDRADLAMPLLAE